ncbi:MULTISPECIES: PTS sugar transporter subunit IIA [Oceanobacillus]|uniref:PTS sugar transporter subunit IIA n=1 Tax=Oceanobacillus TaxID=182709 RepID=UPI0030F4ECFD
MKIGEILDERIIAVNLVAENKDQAITLLSKKLKDAGYINDVNNFKKDIYDREAQGPTGIGNYIAIPHGQSESVTNIGIAIGKFQNEIKWETLDDNGVKVVCLFAVNQDRESADNHLLLLSEFATKLGNDSAVDALLDAKSVQEIKDVFLKEEYV